MRISIPALFIIVKTGNNSTSIHKVWHWAIMSTIRCISQIQHQAEETTKEHISHYSIYVKCRNRQNQSILLEVTIPATSGETGDYWGWVWGRLLGLIWVMVTHVCSCCKSSSSCILKIHVPYSVWMLYTTFFILKVFFNWLKKLIEESTKGK